MFNRFFIGLLIAFWLVVSSGRAFASCLVVDEAMGLLSEVRKVQQRLDVETSSEPVSIKPGGLRAESLVGGDFAEAYPLQAESFSNFITTLNGVDTLEDTAIPEAEVQAFIGALQVMERFWNCTEPEEISPVELFGQSGSMTNLSDTNAVNDTDRVAPETAVSGQSNNRALSQNSGDLRPARIERPTELQVNYMLLLGMVILFIGGMTYVVRKRPKPRETRRIINAAARVTFNRETLNMRVVDITVNGCKIEHADHIHGHKRLKVELDGTWYLGHVKWHNSAFAGVKFQRPLAEDTFNRVVKAALA